MHTFVQHIHSSVNLLHGQTTYLIRTEGVENTSGVFVVSVYFCLFFLRVAQQLGNCSPVVVVLYTVCHLFLAEKGGTACGLYKSVCDCLVCCGNKPLWLLSFLLPWGGKTLQVSLHCFLFFLMLWGNNKWPGESLLCVSIYVCDSELIHPFKCHWVWITGQHQSCHMFFLQLIIKLFWCVCVCKDLFVLFFLSIILNVNGNHPSRYESHTGLVWCEGDSIMT